MLSCQVDVKVLLSSTSLWQTISQQIHLEIPKTKSFSPRQSEFLKLRNKIVTSTSSFRKCKRNANARFLLRLSINNHRNRLMICGNNGIFANLNEIHELFHDFFVQSNCIMKYTIQSNRNMWFTFAFFS